MKIKYEFIDGSVTEVEVSDEIGAVIIEARRLEHNADERERYHRSFSIDAAEYEGTEWADHSTPESEMVQDEDNAQLYWALGCLTEAQRRRFLSYADGLTIREIAAQEGVQIKAVQDSIAQARKKLQKFFK